ncbi:hypothetical protein Dd703_3196 [Musicola paradisiaca Ech703]|uniref:Uncharacterized protein n=1 Tax=Musicola paradisiaca (strain Ech703) TaxID=579405 RepID=C6CD89_MUSP7|nr:hypothetical protein Dd703_3196 [Musicola paradisiaca Ech703]
MLKTDVSLLVKSGNSLLYPPCCTEEVIFFSVKGKDSVNGAARKKRCLENRLGEKRTGIGYENFTGR